MPDAIRTAGLVLTEHEFSVPLDHDRPDGERITVFAREVADPDGRDRPFLVFLQGGPGFEAPRPARHPTAPCWLDRALSEFRVLMLDQRGTGRSTPVGALPGRTPAEQAEYLTHFRADAIVRDAEWIRRELGVERWSVLGQSFGGFCVAHLPLARSRGPARGVLHRRAAADRPPRRRRLPRHLRARARAQPALLRPLPRRPRAGARAAAAGSRPTTCACRRGDRLTGRPLPPARPHAGDERPAPSTCTTSSSCRPTRPPSCTTSTPPLSSPATRSTPSLHEACYADGCATRWSAERAACRSTYDDPELFTGEHVYPWMFEDYSRARAAARGGRDPGERRVAAPLRRRPAARRTRFRPRRPSTPRTCTSSAPSPRRRPPGSAASGRGSRTSTSTTACAPRATASSGRLIDLARGRA